jgi:FMN phosphatase YigB (HAD superfamily)
MEAAILFDFGGTLDWPAHWLDRFLAHYHAAGLELDRATLDEAFTAATAFAYRTADAMRELNLEATIRYLVRYQLATLRETDAHFRATLDVIGSERAEVAISASFAAESRVGLATSRAILEGLAGRFRLGVVSNFYGNLDGILEECGLLPMLAVVVDSSRLGIFKPDRRIFTAAVDAIGLSPARILMVGDSLGKDCAPARALGMRTAWLRHQIPGRDDLYWRQTAQSAKAAGSLTHSGTGAQANPILPDFTIGTLAELQHLKWMNG